MESHNPLSLDKSSFDPIYTNPPVAGFWRRVAAWLIDLILLGIVGQVIGWGFSSFWFQIGPYGRIAGLLIILSYFGLLNSAVGNGQTVGKRLLGIAVRDQNNQAIGIWRSMARAAILSLPWILNGWALPLFNLQIIAWFAIIIVFGLGISIVYTMIFNRSGKQGIHDLICGTYVVNLNGTPVENFPRTPRIHLAISGALIGISTLIVFGLGLVGWYWTSEKPLATIYSLYQNLQADNRFYTVGVNDNTFYGADGKTTRSLQVQIWYKGIPSKAEREMVMNDIAKVVLESGEDLNQYDGLTIAVMSAFDLGIASANLTSGDAQPFEVWQRRISEHSPDK